MIKRRSLAVSALLLAATITAFTQQPQSGAQATSQWQPQFHFSAPPHWINDPNGPILISGQYHLFFQFNPQGDEWGHMSWGHAVTTDLAHWKQLPVALPEENGVMIFSGSTVEDRDNTSGLCGDSGQQTPGCLVAIYTGATADRQTQNLAVSRDSGVTWTKFQSNPVLDSGLKDFRDPKVFWHAPTRSWVMVVALPTQHKVRFYRSKNLRQWEQAGEFGPSGAVSGVWECPDLFELPIHDANGKLVGGRDGTRWVLNVNINPGGPGGGSGDQYFIGRFDGSKFVEDNPNSGPHWADWGMDFYATTSFSDLPPGQDPMWIAWMSNWQYADKLPSLPGRGQMTIARTLSLRLPPAHQRLLPSQEPIMLIQHPVLPVPAHIPDHNWFGNEPFLTIDEANARLASQKISGSAYVIRFILAPGDVGETGIRLRRSSANPTQPASEETVVRFDFSNGRIVVDRSLSGQTSWSPAFLAKTSISAPLKHPQATAIPVEIVVDHNSVEVFAEDGETVLTNLIYPQASSQGIAFYAPIMPGGSAPTRIRRIEFFPLDAPTAASAPK